MISALRKILPGTTDSHLRQCSAASVAGFIASAPMGILMVWLHKVIMPPHKQEPPPEILTRKIVTTEPQPLLAWLFHHLYGAVAATFFPLLFDPFPLASVSIVVRGCVFGALIWVGSYLGWIPAARILPPATRHSANRNLIMISLHFFWGAVMASLYEQLK